MSEIINSQPSDYAPSIFNSFEQCNEAIYAVEEEFSLMAYFDITNPIRFDAEMAGLLPSDQEPALRLAIPIFMKYAREDIRAHRIPLQDVAFLSSYVDASGSRLPLLLRRILCHSDDAIRRERRFLRRHRLRYGIDFVEIVGTMDAESVIIGHKISKLALCHLTSGIFGVPFITAIMMRVCRILWFFDDYKRMHQARADDSLRRRIDNLTQTIDQLKQDVRPMQIATEYATPKHSYLSDSSSIHSDVVMQDRGYSDEIADIHELIATKIDGVSERLSRMTLAMEMVMTKIDDMVDTIATEDRSSFASDVYVSPRRIRNTCIGNERHV